MNFSQDKIDICDTTKCHNEVSQMSSTTRASLVAMKDEIDKLYATIKHAEQTIHSLRDVWAALSEREAGTNDYVMISERILGCHSNPVISLVFSPDCERIVSGSYDGFVEVFRVKGGKSEWATQAHTSAALGVAFSPDGTLIASGSYSMKLRNAGTGECLISLKNRSSTIATIMCVAFSPDGKRVASGSTDKSVTVWDTESGRRWTLENHHEAIMCVAFSPDGLTIVSGSYDNTACVWSVDGCRQFTLRGHSQAVLCVAFSSNGMRIVTGSADKTLKMWLAGECELTLRGHAGGITSVAFSPDGTQIVSGSADHNARVWDAKSGECTTILEGHSGSVMCVAFLPDNRIISASCDKSVRTWGPK